MLALIMFLVGLSRVVLPLCAAGYAGLAVALKVVLLRGSFAFIAATALGIATPGSMGKSGSAMQSCACHASLASAQLAAVDTGVLIAASSQ